MTSAIAHRLPPPTTLPPAPRRVGMRAGLRAHFWLPRLFVLPHTLVGIGAALYVLFLLAATFLGTTIEGHIFKVSVEQGKKGAHYSASYRYSVRGIVREDTDGISAAQFDRWSGPLNGGAAEAPDIPVKVEQFELGPWHISHLGEGTGRGEGLGIVFWALFWDTLIGIFVYQYWVVPLRQRLLIRRGTPVAGMITAANAVRGKGTRYYVTYEFLDLEGTSHSAKFECATGSLFGHAAAGDLITVVIDPGKPKRSIPYEHAPYRVLPTH